MIISEEWEDIRIATEGWKGQGCTQQRGDSWGLGLVSNAI